MSLGGLTVAAVAEVKERCPVNTGREDCKPVMFFTTPNDGRFRAHVSVSSKTQHKAGSRVQLATAFEQEVRHKVLSAVHLSVWAVRNLDEKAEKDKNPSTIN